MTIKYALNFNFLDKDKEQVLYILYEWKKNKNFNKNC